MRNRVPTIGASVSVVVLLGLAMAAGARMSTVPILGIAGPAIRVPAALRTDDGGAIVLALIARNPKAATGTTLTARVDAQGRLDLSYGYEGVARPALGPAVAPSSLAIDPQTGEAWIGASDGGRSEIFALGDTGQRQRRFGDRGVVRLPAVDNGGVRALAWRRGELLAAAGGRGRCSGCVLTLLNATTGSAIAAATLTSAAAGGRTCAGPAGVTSVAFGEATGVLAATEVANRRGCTASLLALDNRLVPFGPYGPKAPPLPAQLFQSVTITPEPGATCLTGSGPAGVGIWPLGDTQATRLAGASTRLVAAVPLAAGGCAALLQGARQAAEVIQTASSRAASASAQIPAGLTPLAMFRCHRHLLVIAASGPAGNQRAVIAPVPITRGPFAAAAATPAADSGPARSATGCSARASRRTAVPASPPRLTALFARASYSPGQVAQLRVVADATRLTVQPIAAFSKSGYPYAPIAGDPAVGPAQTVVWHPGAGTLPVRIGWWASGVYFVRVLSADGQVVVAPLVVRPAHLGQASVAVVVPTYTWQAYNRRGGDTWYACSCVSTVDLSRPYLDGGVPFNFGQYDRDFFQWLSRNNVRVDVLADDDLDRIAGGAQLRRLYRMVVFESHGEYVTKHMFDLTQQYRDLGGHLAFLSANDFFRQVAIRGSSMTLIGRWRDLGRPEAALIGGQYTDWWRGLYPNRPYRVVGADRVPWLFAGTGLRDGSLIPGYYGIEIDGPTSASPAGTTVIATIPNIFPSESADMTYYTTAAGAEVFDAGTINFGGAADNPYVAKMLTNLWAHMAGISAPCAPSPTLRPSDLRTG